VTILQTKKCNIMKYMIFCGGINWDFTASLKKYNEMYLWIKYIKSVLWRVAECLSYIEDVWCLKVNLAFPRHTFMFVTDLFSICMNLVQRVKECWVSVTPKFNLLVPELFFSILSHPVYKMWIIQEPNMLELWNKLHFKEKETESIYCV